MKLTVFIYAMLFLGLPFAHAQDVINEEKCKIFVDQTLKSLDEQTRKYGDTAKLDDLSEENILELQSKNGSCFAMKEINSRLNPSKT